VFSASEALLAFQYQDRDESGHPSQSARVGAMLWAEQIDICRAFAVGYSQAGKKKGRKTFKNAGR